MRPRLPLNATHVPGVAAPTALLLLAAAVAACDSPVEAGYPTHITVSAEPEAAVAGAPIAFRYDARGRYLVEIVLDYGDGAADSVRTFGAQTAGGNLSHAYQTAGTYTVSAQVMEAGGATATADVTVEITPSSSQGR